MSEDEKIRQQCLARERYEHDRASAIEYGIEQGIEKIVVNLLKSGEKPEDIAKKADVSLEKVIEKLKREYEKAKQFFF